MNPLSLVRHLALLGLAYAALVAETSVVPQLNPGGATLRPLWIVLALVVVGGRGSAIVAWAALLGFTSDCLRGNGPLGLDLILATVAVCLLPSEWTRSRIHSITITTLIAVLLITGSESTSRLVRILIVSPNTSWLTDTLPTTVVGSLADALVSSGLLLIVLLGLRGFRRSLGRMLLPAPLST